MNQGTGAIRIGIACILLFGSLSLVVWRQGRALEELRALDAARAERALLQAERSELERSIHRLESRTRIAPVSAQRFGLRTPTRNEIIILRSLPDVATEGSEFIGRGLLTAAEQR